MDASATSAGTDFKLNPVYIGCLVPPLERLERREEPKAQGGEFVETYVAKRTKQISPTRALALDASATSVGSVFEYLSCTQFDSPSSRKA